MPFQIDQTATHLNYLFAISYRDRRQLPIGFHGFFFLLYDFDIYRAVSLNECKLTLGVIL